MEYEMPYIGTRSHAAGALDWYNGDRMSADFEVCGSGAFRTALLHKPTQVVYKIDRRTYANEMSNASEAKRARQLAKREWTNVRIPKVSLYRFESEQFVLAMEYIIGTLGISTNNVHDNMGYKEWWDSDRRGRPYDMHGHNFIIDSEGKFVPVDMGS